MDRPVAWGALAENGSTPYGYSVLIDMNSPGVLSLSANTVPDFLRDMLCTCIVLIDSDK
jgi:hypothetical protein